MPPDQMSKISGQLLISGQFQDICDISGISGQLGALGLHKTTKKTIKQASVKTPEAQN